MAILLSLIKVSKSNIKHRNAQKCKQLNMGNHLVDYLKSISLNNMYHYVTSQLLVAVLKRHVLIVKTSCRVYLEKGRPRVC